MSFHWESAVLLSSLVDAILTDCRPGTRMRSEVRVNARTGPELASMMLNSRTKAVAIVVRADSCSIRVLVQDDRMELCA